MAPRPPLIPTPQNIKAFVQSVARPSVTPIASQSVIVNPIVSSTASIMPASPMPSSVALGGGTLVVYVPPTPAWEYSFAPGLIDAVVSNGDSAFYWNSPITLAAGSISKLGVYISTNPFTSQCKLALYRASDRVKLAQATIAASAVGFNEIAITPVVVPAGNYLIALAALANADLEWSGKASLVNGGLHFSGGGYFAFPVDPLPADDAAVTRICVGAYNTFS